MYGVFSWVELAGPQPIPVNARYAFEPGRTGGQQIQDGSIPVAVTSAIISSDDGLVWTITDGNTTKNLSTTTSETLTIDGIGYTFALDSTAEILTISITSSGIQVGILSPLRAPGRVVRNLERGGESLAPIVILEGINDYEEVLIQVEDPIWDFDPITSTWTYTEGKITVSIRQIHEAGAEFGIETLIESLIVDFRPQGVRPVALPPPG